MKCKQGCVHSCICGGKTNVMAGPAVIQAWVLCTTAATSRRQRADHGAIIGLLTAFPQPSVIFLHPLLPGTWIGDDWVNPFSYHLPPSSYPSIQYQRMHRDPVKFFSASTLGDTAVTIVATSSAVGLGQGRWWFWTSTFGLEASHTTCCRTVGSNLY